MSSVRFLSSCCFRTAIFAFAVSSGAYSSSGQTHTFNLVTDAELQNPAPEDWLMWRRTLNSWGYSPLDQIDQTNVSEIEMVWTRALGPGRQQGTPLVHDGCDVHAKSKRCNPSDRCGHW